MKRSPVYLLGIVPGAAMCWLSWDQFCLSFTTPKMFVTAWMDFGAVVFLLGCFVVFASIYIFANEKGR